MPNGCDFRSGDALFRQENVGNCNCLALRYLIVNLCGSNSNMVDQRHQEITKKSLFVTVSENIPVFMKKSHNEEDKKKLLLLLLF